MEEDREWGLGFGGDDEDNRYRFITFDVTLVVLHLKGLDKS